MRYPPAVAPVALLAAGLLPATSARAQAVPSPTAPSASERAPLGVPLGTRVRVRRAGGAQVVGVLAAVRPDTLVLSSAAEREPRVWTVPYDSVRRVDVSRGRRTRGQGAGRGAFIGLLVGGVPSAAVVAATGVVESSRPCDCMVSGTFISAVLGAALTVTATLTGTIIGAVRPGDRWQRVHLPRRVRAAVGPAPGGAALGVRVGF